MGDSEGLDLGWVEKECRGTGLQARLRQVRVSLKISATREGSKYGISKPMREVMKLVTGLGGRYKSSPAVEGWLRGGGGTTKCIWDNIGRARMMFNCKIKFCH